jgi:hypothetical protein
MYFHGCHLKTKGKKVQGKRHKTGFRVQGAGKRGVAETQRHD